jgi:hypothetical protein
LFVWGPNSGGQGELGPRPGERLAGGSLKSGAAGTLGNAVPGAKQAPGRARLTVLIETIGVAVMMGGGPSVVYGCEAPQAIDQLQPADAQ